MDLSKEELTRYARHLALPHVGMEGQKKLKQAKILVVGAGGLGSPALLYLAAAGVGTIGIVEFDIIEESNLQRQILYTTKDTKKTKAERARQRLLELNPLVKVEMYNERLTSANALSIIKNYHVILDGSDNFPTRYLINDACVMQKKPFVYGAIHQFRGHASVFNFEGGPCYRCLFANPPDPDLIPNCDEAGVLGVLPGIIGTIQATEAIKLILGEGTTLSGRFLVYDALNMRFDELKLKKNPKCPICSKSPVITKLIDYDFTCKTEGINSPANTTTPIINAKENPKKELIMKTKSKKESITVLELKKMIDEGEKPILFDVREDFEREICKLDDDIVYSFRKIQGGDLSFLKKIKKECPIVVYCHTGRRSGIVAKHMREKGYHAINLTGGVEAWANEIDPSMRRY